MPNGSEIKGTATFYKTSHYVVTQWRLDAEEIFQKYFLLRLNISMQKTAHWVRRIFSCLPRLFPHQFQVYQKLL
jgi:hypothetical protein